MPQTLNSERKKMTKYKPRYEDLGEVRDSMTLTGRTSRELVGIEESSQRAVAENLQWLLAKKLNSVRGEYVKGDSKSELEALGFEVLGESDELFYRVKAPEGWDKSTEGLWTIVVDGEGKKRMTQFYKGATYDRDAFLNISRDKD